MGSRHEDGDGHYGDDGGDGDEDEYHVGDDADGGGSMSMQTGGVVVW